MRCSLAAVSAAQALTQDITSQFAITRSGLVLNRTTNTFDSTVTLRNSSGAPVLAPIDVVVGGLPAGVTLANKAGDEPDGRPYVSPMAAGALLQSGGTLTFVLKFANPARVTFTSTLQILYTVEAPPDAPSLLSVVATGGTTRLPDRAGGGRGRTGHHAAGNVRPHLRAGHARRRRTAGAPVDGEDGSRPATFSVTSRA